MGPLTSGSIARSGWILRRRTLNISNEAQQYTSVLKISHKAPTIIARCSPLMGSMSAYEIGHSFLQEQPSVRLSCVTVVLEAPDG